MGGEVTHDSIHYGAAERRASLALMALLDFVPYGVTFVLMVSGCSVVVVFGTGVEQRLD